ncbi:MAG: SBBP repeat-containing protein [Acidobacteria bacterium]|nr:SBBP repeat-containing protein [Acidobacteriota bacterium]
MQFKPASSFKVALFGTLSLLLLSVGWWAKQPHANASPTPVAPSLAAFGQLPLSFEANQGQTDSQVKFRARGNGYSLSLTADEIVLQTFAGPTAEPSATAQTLHSALHSPHAARRNSQVTRLRLIGANPAPLVEGVDELPGQNNHFIGNDPRQWRTNVPTYAKVRYRAIYPGIDLVFYGNGRQVEYDLIVAPGADLNVIKLAVSGAGALRVADNGELSLQDEPEGPRFRAPVVYQQTSGGRTELAGRYVLSGANEVSFAVDAYDKELPLVIDPVIIYSSYLGGNNNETGERVVVDNNGNAYLAGFTTSTNFPSANPLQPNYGGGSRDAFITKLNAAGSALVYSTYLGGNGDDLLAGALGVDATGNVYVAVTTTSTNFPTTANAFRTTNTGFYDSSLAKLNPAGNALLYSTYFGGTGFENSRDLAVNDAGVVWVSGITNSTDLPVKNPLQATNGGNLDEFVAKFDTTQTGMASLLYATYFGGNGDDGGSGLSVGDALAVDSTGNIYLAGPTNSTNLPVLNAFQPAFGGGSRDGFVTKINAAGNALLYSTYLGGNAQDEILALAVDAAGNAYLSGDTASTNFPTRNPLQPANGGNGDAFITKLSPTGSALVYSTYLGGNGSDFGLDVVVDGAGNAYVAGATSSTDFPLTGAVQLTYGGGASDAFVTQLNATGTARLFSTFLGGNNNDVAQSLTATSDGNIYVTGVTSSTNFPVVTNLQPTLSAGDDVFITKLGGQQSMFALTEIRANRGGDTGTASCVIFGTGMNIGATIKLVRTGQPDIVGEQVAVYEFGNRMNATFDLTGKARGVYDVVVTNPGGQTRTITSGFTVEEGRAPQLYTEILGYNYLRGGRDQTYTIVCGNRGNVDAFVVPVRVSVPDFITLTPGFTIINPPQPAGVPPVDYSQASFTTRSNGRNEGVILYPMVPAGGVREVTVKLRVADVFTYAHAQFNILATPGIPLVMTFPSAPRPPNSPNAPNAPQAGFAPSPKCIQSFISLVFDCGSVAFPPLLCADSLAAFGGQALTSLAATSFDPRTGSGDVAGTFAGIAWGGVHAAINCSPIGEVFAVFQCTTSAINFFDNCFGNGGGAGKQGQVIVSGDPNLKLGPDGASAQHYIGIQPTLSYAVLFENKAEATAAAQDVVITDQLDPAKVELSTFELGPIAFGNKLVIPPPGSKTFNTDVDLRPQTNLFARINVSFNQSTGLITWTFASIDPATGQPTTNPVLGFLPPNVTSPQGEGRVLFTVAPKAGLTTGTVITNQARIVFDANPPIDTPVWSNTIDITPPTSQVTALPANSCASFNVQWSGSDPDSGIGGFLIYVSDNGGPYSPYRSTSATSAFFIGEQGHTYRFYSIASDRAGNFEANPAAPPDTQTTVNTTTSLAPTNHNVAGTGGNASTNVTAVGGCGWTASSNVPWITITSGASGAGNGTVNFTVAPNVGPARGGTLTVAGQTVSVSQAAQSCTFNISPTSANLGAGGGNGSSNVTTTGGCAWPATSDVAWITPNSASGTGSGAANYTVAANTGPARTGTLTIAGQTVTVTQSSGCSYAINPTSQTFPGSGGAGSVTVTTPGVCGWTAASNAPWLTILSDVNNTVMFSVARNPGPQRSGTLTIAGQTFTVTQNRGLAVKADFDGDGKTDLGVFSPSAAPPVPNWMVLNSNNGLTATQQWGAGYAPYFDTIVPGDYDGDGKAADSIWYIRKSSDGQAILQFWGANYAPYFDIPTPGDYDGDGKTDIAVWRRDGTWYVKRSSNGSFLIQTHGQNGDIPVPADYDGDGKTDLAVFRPGAIAPTPNWLILNSSTNTVTSIQWGAGYAPYFDTPVPADYDGDGKADLAIWRGADSIWYIRKSSDGGFILDLWGANYAPYFDVPTPGDYDGDGKADIAVWRRSGTWFVKRSSNGSFLIQNQGQNGDVPVPAYGVR